MATSKIKGPFDEYDNTSVSGATFARKGGVVFVALEAASAGFTIPAAFRPNSDRFISGLIQYSGDGDTHIVEADVKTNGNTTWYYQSSIGTRTGFSNSSVYGTAFYLI